MDLSLELRAREIAEFLGIPEADAIAKLSRGFGELHNEVTADFRRCNPQSDAELLEWYRTTEAYIWELSSYHLDPGFNYSGMCEGIATRLKDEGADKVLCLGDGIGDLTMTLRHHGLYAIYHDLEDSVTAEFALKRHRDAKCGGAANWCNADWEPDICCGYGEYGAIVSLDFLEHVTDLPHWLNAIYAALKPGGLFVAQNGFDCGSGPDGAMPMHLSRNDKYAHATPETNGLALWDHLLFGLGFEQISSNWYRRPA